MRTRGYGVAVVLMTAGLCVGVGLVPGKLARAALLQAAPLADEASTRRKTPASAAASRQTSSQASSRASGQEAGKTPAAKGKGDAVTNRATGTFDVKLTPQQDEGSPLGRLTIDKQFHGGITGQSKGQMLAASTAVKGSAGYVALEQVTGAVDGRRGTFFLQHSGTMTRGTPSLALSVVPDSGTDQLVGLSGTMTIDIAADGTHSYTFAYTIAATPAP